jgi:hypothetical protein
MTKRRLTFWIDEELALGLKAVKDRDGVPESEQLRRALRAWFEAKGINPMSLKSEDH